MTARPIAVSSMVKSTPPTPVSAAEMAMPFSFAARTLTPAARAVEWGADALSYAELLACAGRVAAWLRDAGVVADAVVALQLANYGD